MFRQLSCQRLDDIENGAHVPFVVRQDHIGCYGIRNDKYVLRQQRFKRYCAVRCDLIVLVRCNLNLGRFQFGT